ncbi:MAG: hypothetical protein K0S19_1579 [Geminicoccaceae bacterium]|nr:hypothetical protein [Geminicoccaceae bacterium]
MWYAELDLERQSPTNHIYAFPYIRWCSGHDINQADSFGRSAVKDDVALEAEQGYGDLTRALPSHGRPQAGHSHRTSGRNYQR